MGWFSNLWLTTENKQILPSLLELSWGERTKTARRQRSRRTKIKTKRSPRNPRLCAQTLCTTWCLERFCWEQLCGAGVHGEQSINPRWSPVQSCLQTILVGGLEHFLFSHILGISSSQLMKSIIFQRGGYTTNHHLTSYSYGCSILKARIPDPYSLDLRSSPTM